MHFIQFWVTLTLNVGRQPNSQLSLLYPFQVYLQCGNTNQVVNVSEPKTCNYKLVFTTPLVCHPHSILVYPTLNKTLQQEWNLIEGRLQAEEITQKVNPVVITLLNQNEECLFCAYEIVIDKYHILSE